MEATGDPKITKTIVDTAIKLKERAETLGENYIDLNKNEITEDEIIAAEKAQEEEKNLENIYQN